MGHSEINPLKIDFASIVLKLDGQKELDKTKLESLTVTNSINDHAAINFKYTIAADQDQRKYFSKLASRVATAQKTDDEQAQPDYVTVELSVKQPEPDGEVVLKGIVTKIQITGTILEVDGNSYTILLDREKTTRAFQNPGPVQNVVKKKLGEKFDITGADQLAGEAAMVLQYNETDWQFFKRLASCCKNTQSTGKQNTAKQQWGKVLIANPAVDSRGFDIFSTVGQQTYKSDRMAQKDFPKLDELDQFFCTENTIFDFRNVDTTQVSGIHYEMVLKSLKDGYPVYPIGNCIAKDVSNNQNPKRYAPLYVYSSKLSIEKESQSAEHIITITYKLAPLIEQPEIINQAIAGISIDGTVLEVDGASGSNKAKDQVKLALDNEEKGQSNNLPWFQVATLHAAQGNTGLYCMPEEGDNVKLYFPTAKETSAFVLTALRQGPRSDVSPDIKSVKTLSGTEITFNEKEIALTVHQYDEQKNSVGDKIVWITLNQDTGVEIHSANEIRIISEDDLNIHSDAKDKTVTLSAAEALLIRSGGNQGEDDLAKQGKTNIYLNGTLKHLGKVNHI